MWFLNNEGIIVEMEILDELVYEEIYFIGGWFVRFGRGVFFDVYLFVVMVFVIVCGKSFF